jgi:hypothetical protein
MIGNLGMLGQMDPSRALNLTTTKETYPVWTIKLDMPRDEIIEYKFLILKAPSKNSQSRREIIFENLPPGINRIITTQGKRELTIAEEFDNT